MHIQIRDKKNWYAGLMFIAWGGLFAGGATRYRMGVAAKMGPGYFPFMLGTLLAALGLLLLLFSLGTKGQKQEVGKALLAADAPHHGLHRRVRILAEPRRRGHRAHRDDRDREPGERGGQARRDLISTAVLIFGAISIFSWGLHLQFPIWPRFLGL